MKTIPLAPNFITSVCGIFMTVLVMQAAHSDSQSEPKPMTCEMSGTATLVRNYGDLKTGDVLDVSLSLQFSGIMGVSYSKPVTESGKMRVSHKNGSYMESHITHVNTWDRKTSSTSFMTRILGPYKNGNIAGISGEAPTEVGRGWRPGIEFFGETAGTKLDGRFPVSPEDWALLSKRTLTMPDPTNENSIMNVARLDDMKTECQYSVD